MDNIKIEDCSVVVSSCGSYEDVWPVFFSLFHKYWPDCPFKIYLITDKVTYNDDRVHTILLEKDMGWSRNIRYALNQINTPFYIFFIEDYLLQKKVDTDRMMQLYKHFISNNLDYLRLLPLPAPDKNFNYNLKIGEIGLSAPYRLSLMAALWKTATFLELLRDDENAWQMELVGSDRSRNEKYKFWSVMKGFPAVDYFVTGIKKGRWLYDAVKFLKDDEGIEVHDRYHKIEEKSVYLKRKLRALPIIGKFFCFIFPSK